MSVRVVLAALALPAVGVAAIGVPVTLAGAAGGEAPLARLAFRALAPGSALAAHTLARGRVTAMADCALGVAVTGWGAERTKVIHQSLQGIYKAMYLIVVSPCCCVTYFVFTFIPFFCYLLFVTERISNDQ